MTEAATMRALQLVATERGGRLFRNNSGIGWVGRLVSKSGGSVLLADARPLHAGLGVGSSDLIGLTSAGIFLSIEVKSPRGRTTPEQSAWLDMVRRMGGVAGVCRSVEDLEGLM